MNYVRLIIISLIGALVVAGGFYLIQRQSPLGGADKDATQITQQGQFGSSSASQPVTDPSSTQPITQLDEIRFYLDKSDFLNLQARLLAIDPPTQLSSYHLGLLSAYFGDRRKAEAYIDQAIKMNTEQELTQKAKGIKDAYDEFDTFKGGKPEHLRALIAGAFLANGEAELALSGAKAITQSSPDYKDGWKILGFAHIIKENYSNAISALEKLTPTDNSEVNYYLGVAYYNLEDYTRAVNYLDFAERENFKPDLYLKEILTESYLALGNYQKAVQIQEELLSTTSQSVQAYGKPIWIYIEVLQEPSRAIYLALQAVSRYPTNAFSYALAGWAYTANGEYDRALDYLNRAREFNTNEPVVYLNLGHLHKARGETENAIIYYQRAKELNPDGVYGKRAEEEIGTLRRS